eukprot:306734-Chlamydomonas_euryale.AAC.1
MCGTPRSPSTAATHCAAAPRLPTCTARCGTWGVGCGTWGVGCRVWGVRQWVELGALGSWVGG